MTKSPKHVLQKSLHTTSCLGTFLKKNLCWVTTKLTVRQGASQLTTPGWTLPRTCNHLNRDAHDRTTSRGSVINMKAFHLRSTLSKCTRCVYSRETASNRPYVPLIQKKGRFFFFFSLKIKVASHLYMKRWSKAVARPKRKKNVTN